MSVAKAQDSDLARTVQIIQTSFPQIYLACHTRHQRKKSTPHRLSSRDSSILAHLDEREPISPARLAKHLGVSAPTLSEALKRLARLGFIVAPENGSTFRRTKVLLSPHGAAAIRDTSVLETERLEAIVRGLSRAERKSVAAGLARLGDACREHAELTSVPRTTRK